MPDETSPTTGQEPASGQGQAPTPSGLTLEQAQEALTAARKEAAGYRTRLSALEKAQQDADAAKLSEQEKLAKRAAQLEVELEAERADRRDKINRYEVQLQASKLGIVDPEAAVKLLDWDAIEYGDDGSPKDVEGALKKLIAKKPYLVAQPGQQPPANPTNPATGRGRAQLTVADVKAMSKDQINARWNEVQAALRRGV